MRDDLVLDSDEARTSISGDFLDFGVSEPVQDAGASSGVDSEVGEAVQVTAQSPETLDRYSSLYVQDDHMSDVLHHVPENAGAASQAEGLQNDAATVC